MRKVLRMAGLVALLVGLAPCVRAADLSGTWKGAFDFQGSSVPLTLHLTVAGNAVTGTVEGLETSPAEIHDGKLDGTTVSFWRRDCVHVRDRGRKLGHAVDGKKECGCGRDAGRAGCKRELEGRIRVQRQQRAGGVSFEERGQGGDRNGGWDGCRVDRDS